MPLSVGDPAPDFALRNQHGQTVRLSDLRGRKAVLVVFYPWAFSGVCGGELTALQAALDDLVADDLEVLTVSTDSMYALRAFADQQGLTFPMLSDFWPHGEVAEAYGVLHPEIGIALRGSFLVDRDGVVRWTVVKGIPDARDVDDYRKAIADL
ncbi:MAG TPA: peroxiredoxin [Actinomycetes bacterium]|nr:peroxiredoxin [Actinomycetes bacterium]